MLGGCLLIALLLRVPWLPVPLGRDEGGLTFLAQHWDGLSLYGDYWVDRPPVLILLFKLAALGGTGGVRALGAVAACALVVAITLLARRLAGPRAGMIAALLAALMTGSSAIRASTPRGSCWPRCRPRCRFWPWCTPTTRGGSAPSPPRARWR